MAWGKCNDRSINRSIVTVIQRLTRKYWLRLAWLDKFNELFCFLFIYFLLSQLEPNSIAPNRMDSSRTSGNAINIICAMMVSPRRSSAPMVLSLIHWTARSTNAISPSMWTARIVLNCVRITHILALSPFSFLLAVLSTEEPKSTKYCPRKNGFFAHPEASVCNIFYNCIDGDALEMKCTVGLHFDEYSGTCVWPDTAKREGCGDPESE